MFSLPPQGTKGDKKQTALGTSLMSGAQELQIKYLGAVFSIGLSSRACLPTWSSSPSCDPDWFFHAPCSLLPGSAHAFPHLLLVTAHLRCTPLLSSPYLAFGSAEQRSLLLSRDPYSQLGKRPPGYFSSSTCHQNLLKAGTRCVFFTVPPGCSHGA